MVLWPQLGGDRPLCDGHHPKVPLFFDAASKGLPCLAPNNQVKDNPVEFQSCNTKIFTLKKLQTAIYHKSDSVKGVFFEITICPRFTGYYKVELEFFVEVRGKISTKGLEPFAKVDIPTFSSSPYVLPWKEWIGSSIYSLTKL